MNKIVLLSIKKGVVVWNFILVKKYRCENCGSKMIELEDMV